MAQLLTLYNASLIDQRNSWDARPSRAPFPTKSALAASKGKDPSAVYVQLATPTPSVRTVVFRGFLGPLSRRASKAAQAGEDGPASDPSLPIPSRDAPPLPQGTVCAI